MTGLHHVLPDVLTRQVLSQMHAAATEPQARAAVEDQLQLHTTALESSAPLQLCTPRVLVPVIGQRCQCVYYMLYYTSIASIAMLVQVSAVTASSDVFLRVRRHGMIDGCAVR